MRVARFFVVVTILLLFASAALAAIPPLERAALEALYNSTGGPSWTNNTNWLQPGVDECSWYGVGCDWTGTTVIDLYLPENNLSGPLPPELQNLTGVMRLVLMRNSLTGPIPPELGSLPALERIYLESNALTGSIPSSFASLGALTELYLGDNQLSGPIPPALGSLPLLEVLWLERNALTGSIPAELGNLAALTTLSIATNALTGTIPPELGQLTALKTLALDGNELTGTIPVQLANLTNLEIFTLGFNQLTGSIPPELGNLSHVTYFWLVGNQLSGSIPPELANLTAVTTLTLAANSLTGSIPPELANLPSVQVLELGSNELSGSIPPEFGNLSTLMYLNLSMNQLTGNIPPELGNLSKLLSLSLDRNQLTGIIPPEIFNLSQLTSLTLRSNHLDGALPPALGNLVAAKTVDLSHNRFSGSIPAEIGNLKNLQNLGLGSNGLTGEIPAGVMGATSLTSINLSYNALRATDPTVYAWIEARSQGWFGTQTSPPTQINFSNPCDTQIDIAWNDGFAVTRFEVWIDRGTGFVLAGSAISGLFTVTGLMPASNYQFMIRSVSEPWYYNENRLESEFSAPVSATTGVLARFTTVTVPEGNGGPVARTFSVTLDPPPAIPTTIQWTTYGGDASADDFTSATGVLSFAPGEVTKTFEVTIVGDTLDEPDETFYLGLSGATGVCTYQPATVTIADDDNPPTITIGNVTEVEGTDTWHYADVPLTLDAPSGHLLWITWSAVAQSATENDDYIVYPDTFYLLPGQTSATLTVILIPDSIDEPDETLAITVSGANLTLPASNGVVTITDDDDPPNLGNYDIWVGEDDAGTPGASATFTLDNISAWTATVEWTLIGETATAGADFAPASGVLTFAPGETWKQISIPVLDDTIDEELETFKLVFTNAAHISVPSELRGTIADDDFPPTPRVTPPSVIEGDSGTHPRTLTVSLSNPSSRTVAFDWAIRSLGALAGQDFVDVTGTVTFLPGETEKNITVEIIGDTTYEWDETFAISMTGAEGLASTDYIAITNDDPKPNLSISDTRVSEGDDGTKIEAITVRLDVPSGRNVNFEWVTSPGTASAGSDYFPTSGTGFFPTGTTASLVYVGIIGDTAVDYGEVFYVHVTAADEATIVDGKAECLIMDDDVAPRVPDPVIHVTGCIEVDAPCELTVLSGTQWDQSDWSYVWSVDGVARGNTLTWFPNFTEAGTYGVTLVATNDEGSGLAAVTLLLAESTGRCPEEQLCMHSKRFLLSLSARDQRTGRTVPGVPLQQNDIFGYFALPALTGSAAIPEVFVKVIDGRPVNGNFWNFFGGLTDLEYTLTVSDSITGDIRSYLKPAGSTAGGFDTGSGVTPETCASEVDGTEVEPVKPNVCAGGVDGLCLQGARFLVEVTARDQRTGRTGTGLAVPQNDVFGYFALPELTNNGANPEVFVKLIDGRDVNGSYWIFYGGLTDLEYTVTVTDTMRGTRKTYTKAAGSACGAFDTNAF